MGLTSVNFRDRMGLFKKANLKGADVTLVKKLWDFTKLRARIHERFPTEADFARSIGLGKVSLRKRLNCEVDFSTTELTNACAALGLSAGEIPQYFFTLIV